MNNTPANEHPKDNDSVIFVPQDTIQAIEKIYEQLKKVYENLLLSGFDKIDNP